MFLSVLLGDGYSFLLHSIFDRRALLIIYLRQYRDLLSMQYSGLRVKYV
jgi:hypothetical protein